MILKWTLQRIINKSNVNFIGTFPQVQKTILRWGLWKGQMALSMRMAKWRNYWLHILRTHVPHCITMTVHSVTLKGAKLWTTWS